MQHLHRFLMSCIFLNRCQLWEKEIEVKEMKDQLKELLHLLRQSEMRKREVEKELRLREQAAVNGLSTPPPVSFHMPVLGFFFVFFFFHFVDLHFLWLLFL